MIGARQAFPNQLKDISACRTNGIMDPRQANMPNQNLGFLAPWSFSMVPLASQSPVFMDRDYAEF